MLIYKKSIPEYFETDFKNKADTIKKRCQLLLIRNVLHWGFVN